MLSRTNTHPLWKPTQKQINRANLTRFIHSVEAQHQIQISDYPALYDWSIKEPEKFWVAVWKFCEIKSSLPWHTVRKDADQMPGARWFQGSRLNFAENLLQKNDDQAAIIFHSENGIRGTISYQELNRSVKQLACALRAQGIGVGDRVAGYLPNRPEAVIAMLATTATGAIWTSCSPDFGIQGVLDRFAQIEPKMLFVTDGYYYGGRWIDIRERISAIIKTIRSIKTTVLVPYSKGESTELKNTILFDPFIYDNDSSNLRYEQLPFSHPVYILYSSGTTGKPKCIIHSAGGTLLQHAKELVLHTDLKSGERIFYFTTCGWMMWNWLVSALSVGASIVLYDGSPFYPARQRLFDLAEREKINVFGISAKYLSALEKSGEKPALSHDLNNLRTILSTGSPLSPESYDFVYRDIKPEVQLSSISGGTDIVSCFALGNTLLPVYRGELQCRGLGMKVEVFNPQGHSVKEQKGELVCTAPFPSMPVGFWNDLDDRLYKSAYFEKFPGVWTHGDYAEITAHDGLIIYGRSDTVLNPGGVRIGTAEIYRQVEQQLEVLDSIAVGQQWQDDTRILLFVVLRTGLRLDNQLIKAIKTRIRENASPRHVPAQIIQVSDIPRTFNGKLSELAVHNTIHGHSVENRDALANPEALAEYEQFGKTLFC